MFRRVPRLSELLPILLLCLSAWPSYGAEPAVVENDRRVAVDRINELMREDRRAEALPLCRQYTAEHPDDPTMLYNLACLENTNGDRELAVTAFRAALRAGFGEFELAARDPDLQGDIGATIRELSGQEQARLSQLSRDQSLVLDLGAWSEARDLLAHGSAAPGEPRQNNPPQVRLRWHDAALEFEVTAEGEWDSMTSSASLAPWNGGPGFLLSLSVPDGTSNWESNNHFLFAFGIESKSAIGAMFVTSQGRWQPVAELVPKTRVDETGRLHMTGLIPWQALMPFNPVVDSPLGVNATLLIADGQRRRRATLVETNDTLNPLAARRRFALLEFHTNSISSDLFLGKLSTSLSTDRPLDVDLVAISTQDGEATLSLNFMDQAGRSVLPDGPLRGKIDLLQGTNRIRRQADFSSLTSGGYLMQAELTFPSGRQETWGATVLQLADEWQSDYRERLSLIAQSEQATVRHLLNAVTTAVAHHMPRRSPGAIVATLLDLENMLADADEQGSILPSKGSFKFVYPGPDGQERLCHMYLPAGRANADGLNPIIALGHGGDQESRLAERIGRNYEYGKQKPTLKTGDDDRFPVYLVPELQPDPAQLSATLLTEAEACRRWALEYFAVPVVALVGIDALGGTALQMAGHLPTELSGLLVCAGQGLNPWPQAQPAFIRQQLGPAPAQLPITWLDFAMETDGAGQARDILQALKELGYRIDDEQSVRGALNLTQVADRLVLWAESLR